MAAWVLSYSSAEVPQAPADPLPPRPADTARAPFEPAPIEGSTVTTCGCEWLAFSHCDHCKHCCARAQPTTYALLRDSSVLIRRPDRSLVITPEGRFLSLAAGDLDWH